jgi:outer membrane protein OmpA-like peptidoglycan-associated protein
MKKFTRFLIVIAIIGILAAIATPVFAGGADPETAADTATTAVPSDPNHVSWWSGLWHPGRTATEARTALSEVRQLKGDCMATFQEAARTIKKVDEKADKALATATKAEAGLYSETTERTAADDALEARIDEVAGAVETLTGRVTTLEGTVAVFQDATRKRFEALATDMEKAKKAASGRTTVTRKPATAKKKTAAPRRKCAVSTAGALALEGASVSGQIIRELPPFDERSSTLTPKQKAALDTAVAEAKAATPTAEWKVVRGYASPSGGKETNAALAAARAKAVATYLKAKGVDVTPEAPATSPYNRAAAVLYGNKP